MTTLLVETELVPLDRRTAHTWAATWLARFTYHYEMGRYAGWLADMYAELPPSDARGIPRAVVEHLIRQQPDYEYLTGEFRPWYGHDIL